MSRETLSVMLDEQQMREMRYLVDEGAAFELELAQATKRSIAGIGEDLDMFRSMGLAEARESEFGAPGYTYVPTEKAYELVMGVPPEKVKGRAVSIISKMQIFKRKGN